MLLEIHVHVRDRPPVPAFGRVKETLKLRRNLFAVRGGKKLRLLLFFGGKSFEPGHLFLAERLRIVATGPTCLVTADEKKECHDCHRGQRQRRWPQPSRSGSVHNGW